MPQHQYTIILLGGAMAESSPSGNYLVRVRAQVMTRDDSTGGWVPMGGGGLSNVSVRKRAILSEDEAKHEYLIYGKRMSDQTVVLSCTIKRDFEYNKVMPTFHHWRTGDKKFGLTFQTAADARAFDKGVRQAVEDLLDDVGEDDVFMTVELPVERGDSRSSSGSSTNGGIGSNGNGMSGYPSSTVPGGVDTSYLSSSPYTHPHANHHHLHRIHYISRPQRTGTPNGSSNNGSNGGNGNQQLQLQLQQQQQQQHQQQQRSMAEEVWMKPPKNKVRGGVGGGGGGDSDKIEILPGDQDSYVQFARESRPSPHEYSYPMMDALKSGEKMMDSSMKMKQQHNFEVRPPLLPTKKRRKKEKNNHFGQTERVRCRHCHEMFTEEENERGRCEYAPDHVRTCVEAVSCIRCAQCMLYHCMSDAEGDFAHHPCSCDASDGKCGKRWIGLVLLSFFVPCLWCYLPLGACHKCGVRCGTCGGRHEAS